MSVKKIKFYSTNCVRKELIMKLKNKFKKILSSVCIAAFAITATAGCSAEFGTNPKVDPKQVVAKPTRLCFTGELDVTYEEFSKEYLFYLNANGISEDDSSNSETCESLRESIINNEIYDKVMLLKAKELGCDVLTDEETKQVDDEFNSEIENEIATFGENADYSDLAEGTEITDEIKKERGEQEFNKMLEDCGMTRDDIYTWIKNYYISQKMAKHFISELEPNAAEDMLNAYIDDIKEIYETDVAQYEQGDYYVFWAPEGSRRIKQVLLGFDDETLEAIEQYRKDGNDEAADKLREEKAKELADKQKEVEQALDDGDDWDGILLQYSADAQGSSLYPDGYLVIPNGTAYVDEFQEAAFVPEKIGDRTTCVSDYGLHILIYAGSGEVSEDERNDIIEYLKYNLAQNEYSAKMNEWVDSYAFDIDYAALRITKEDSEESTDS